MRLLIDTDPGMGTDGADPEDGIAILWALDDPDVDVEGITVVAGNVPLGAGWANALHLLDLAGHGDVPVHAGAARPSDPDRRALQAGWLGGREKGLATVPDEQAGTAAGFLVDTVLAAPGEITLVAIGPLTNVAEAIEKDPDFVAGLAGLVIMGGTVRTPGNITPAAEFNIWMDPESAAVVFGSGAPITMVGLDVCHRTRFDRDDAVRLRGSGSALSELVGSSAERWMDVRARFEDVDALHLYDTLAVAAAIDPGLVTTEDAVVEIETSRGPAQGMTVTHLGGPLTAMLTARQPNASVAADVDLDRFESRFAAFAERL
ncbi:MAG: nucleoside hydrolase [Actinomycetota bacterium]